MKRGDFLQKRYLMEQNKKDLSVIDQDLPLKNRLPLALVEKIEGYPENKRRPVNKTVFKNEYFQLTYNTKNVSLAISSNGDLVYSAIPYDTGRNYIQRAAIQYLLHP